MVDLRIELPEHFLEEEVRDGYKVSAKMKQVWAVELDLLAELIRVCSKHGIKWYPDGGTMLGAVRHQGFIPWDNDIDIALPRQDYDRLCAVAAEEFNAPYFFQTAETESHYPRLHAQLRNSDTTGILLNDWAKYGFNQGIFIDIFPFDSIPDDDLDVETMGRKLISLSNRMSFHNEYAVIYRQLVDCSWFSRFKHSLKHFLTVVLFDRAGREEKLFRDAVTCAESYCNQETKRFANLSLPQFTLGRKNYFYKEWYEETIPVRFEFFEVPVPKGFDKYLYTLYGDWKKFVVSGSLHGDTFFDVDRPYIFYYRPDSDFL